VIAVDTAHGHSRAVLDAVRDLKRNFKGIEIVAGNVATGEGAAALCEARGGCREGRNRPRLHLHHRVVAGVGVPQISAIDSCVRAVTRHGVALHLGRRDQVLGRHREGARRGRRTR